MKEGKPYLGIIGGSGIYDLDNISNAKWQNVSSKFGEPVSYTHLTLPTIYSV